MRKECHFETQANPTESIKMRAKLPLGVAAPMSVFPTTTPKQDSC